MQNQSKTQLVQDLNKLIQVNLDRKAGYQKAKDNIEEPGLQNLFQECSDQSAAYAATLSNMVAANGGSPENATSTGGDLYRVWMDIKSALSANDVKAALQSCEKGEDIALETYNDITQSNGHLPENVQPELERQRTGIQSMHHQIRSLRDNQ